MPRAAASRSSTSPPVLTVRDLNRAALARQMLLAREKATPAEAIARVVALQAQLPRPPFVGLWSRLANFRREQLTTAIHDRSVVRGTAMRATLHLMTARDYATFRGALQPMLEGGPAMLKDRLAGLELPALLDVAHAHFKSGPTPFDALRAAIKKTFPKADERALAYVVRLNVPLLQVPNPDAAWGYDVGCDFTMADVWLKRKVSVAHASATELVKRYLAAYGPATIADAQAWSGLKGLKPVFDALRPSLAVFRDERGRELFDVPAAPRPSRDTRAPVRLLPEFDALVLGYADRSRVVPPEHNAKVTSKNLQVAAVFLVDGMAAGTWKIAGTAKKPAIAITPWGTLAKSARAEVDAEADALLRWMSSQDHAASHQEPSPRRKK